MIRAAHTIHISKDMKAVQMFTDRNYGIHTLWSTIQSLKRNHIILQPNRSTYKPSCLVKQVNPQKTTIMFFFWYVVINIDSKKRVGMPMTSCDVTCFQHLLILLWNCCLSTLYFLNTMVSGVPSLWLTEWIKIKILQKLMERRNETEGGSEAREEYGIFLENWIYEIH